jgi:hypothetical protein
MWFEKFRDCYSFNDDLLFVLELIIRLTSAVGSVSETKYSNGSDPFVVEVNHLCREQISKFMWEILGTSSNMSIIFIQ